MMGMRGRPSQRNDDDPPTLTLGTAGSKIDKRFNRSRITMVITQSIVIRKADTGKHEKKVGSQTINLDNIADYANPALE